MERYPNARSGEMPGTDVLDTIGGVELLEDRTRRLEVAPHGRRLGVSVPTAAVGAVLVAALAFGAAGVPGGEARSDRESDTAGQGGGAHDFADDRTPKPGKVDDAAEPTAMPKTEQPSAAAKDGPAEGSKAGGTVDGKVDATDRPTDAPDQDPAPAVEAIEIRAGTADGKVVVKWGACRTDGFYAWKVVRSSDSTVTWPKGGDDTTVAAFGDVAVARAVDGTAAAGAKVYYRVFAIALVGGSKLVACATGTKGIVAPERRPDATPKPTPKPTTKPASEPPVIGTLEVAVRIVEGRPRIEWSSCKADSYDGYKVIRSTDPSVSFPEGSGDTLVAFVGADGKGAAYDKHAPAGRKLWYRVFCVDKTDAGYVVRAASAARAVATPASSPPPDPVTLGFELDQTDEGVALAWQASTSDRFVFYKVVRSASSNPSYLPGTDGSTVIAVIDTAAKTTLLDRVDAGTWYYRVQAIGYHDGAKVLLGQTTVLSVSVE